MKLTIRKIGNSLGVIIPKSALDKWRLGEGDELDLKDDRIVPAGAGFTKSDLDGLRLERAFAIVRLFTPREIRAKGLANLHGWKASGVWNVAYQEWKDILADPDDGRLFAAMLGRDEESVRLRQSAPYVGLLPQDVVLEMNEKISDPHDMAVSKYIAGRETDLLLLEGLVGLGVLDKHTLLERLHETSVDEARRAAAKARIERQFSDREIARPRKKSRLKP